MPETSRARPTALAVWLIIAGVLGWIAAFSLTIEKLEQAAGKTAASCDFSVLVQCTANLNAWQGSVFGFPNPLIGLAAWVAPIVVGFAILAGARFARWFWLAFWAGMAFAMGFVIWLIAQSIYSLGTLCPWCMLTWAVTIPTFYAVTVHLFKSGVIPIGERGRNIAASLSGAIVPAAVLSYALILLLAQLRLDAVPNIIDTIF